MTCDELRDDYELYAMGALDDPAQEELRSHLNRGCPACSAGVRGARDLMTALAGLAPGANPPARLRRRVLASVGVVPGRFGWIAAFAVAAACFAVAGFYFYGRSQSYAFELARAREDSRRQAIQMARLNEALTLLNQPETKQVTFGEGPKGRVFVSPGRGVLLIASNLPPAPAGKTYEMWIIPKQGKPAPAGLFQSSADGTAMHMETAAVDLTQIAAVAVTVENAGGAAQPTVKPLIVAAL